MTNTKIEQQLLAELLAELHCKSFCDGVNPSTYAESYSGDFLSDAKAILQSGLVIPVSELDWMVDDVEEAIYENLPGESTVGKAARAAIQAIKERAKHDR